MCMFTLRFCRSGKEVFFTKTAVVMKIKISPSLPLFLLSLAASKDMAFMMIPVLAAFIHECGHLIAAKSMRLPIKTMRLGVFGASIETDTLFCSYWKEAALAFCGPLANFLSSGFVYICFGAKSRHSVLFIVASLFLALLNLLPAGSFDGGRIFSSLLHLLLPSRAADRAVEIMSFFIFFILWTVSVYFILKTGAYLSLFIFSCSLFVRLFLQSK